MMFSAEVIEPEVEMQPGVALWHYREGRMSVDEVLVQTGSRSFAELYESYIEQLADSMAADADMRMTEDDHDRAKYRADLNRVFGTYLSEFCAPGEFEDEVDRFMKAGIVFHDDEQRYEQAARRGFRRQ